MNQQHETFVISRTDDGFRVYNPADPTKSYTVGGGPDQPTCTCPDFQHHEGTPNWHCKHILAVLNQVAGSKANSYEAEERQAIQEEGGLVEETIPAQMVLKRSVSPDGRIDSLSVEFSLPVAGASEDIKEHAFETLRLQDEIVEGFLAANGRDKVPQPPTPSRTQNGNGPTPAQMLTIGGINTKWGRRLYIGVQANGQTLKFFGSRKQLADALTAAGYAQLAERIDEGKQLNVPCRVVTKPSEDGRYVNVERVLPAETQPQRRTW